jgi:hypothetical protein
MFGPAISKVTACLRASGLIRLSELAKVHALDADLGTFND